MHKTGQWTANNNFGKAQEQNNLLTQPFSHKKRWSPHFITDNSLGILGEHEKACKSRAEGYKLIEGPSSF